MKDFVAGDKRRYPIQLGRIAWSQNEIPRPALANPIGKKPQD
jgi:hypothetical protein